MRKKRNKRKKIPFWIEPMKKPSRPIGTKKGKKGYDRKREKRRLRRDIEFEPEDYEFESY